MSIDTNKETHKEEPIYSLSDTCPSCGDYTYDGGVCYMCRKNYNLIPKETFYIEK